MRLVKEEKGNEFHPFNITLRIETEEEARLLWHVFNRINLWEAINGERYNTKDQYAEPAEDFTEGCDEIGYFILKHNVKI